MPFYESVFLVRPDVSAQQVEALAQAFSDSVSENGGKVQKVEHWGLRNLTYRIKKNRKAHYVLFNLDAPPKAIQGLEQSMRMSEDVLRSLTIRVNELEEGPSVIMQNRGRDDRPKRDRRTRGGEDSPKTESGDGDANKNEEVPSEEAIVDNSLVSEETPDSLIENDQEDKS